MIQFFAQISASDMLMIPFAPTLYCAQTTASSDPAATAPAAAGTKSHQICEEKSLRASTEQRWLPPRTTRLLRLSRRRW